MAIKDYAEVRALAEVAVRTEKGALVQAAAWVPVRLEFLFPSL